MTNLTIDTPAPKVETADDNVTPVGVAPAASEPPTLPAPVGNGRPDGQPIGFDPVTDPLPPIHPVTTDAPPL